MNRYIGITGVMPTNLSFVLKEYEKVAAHKSEKGLIVPDLACGILVSRTTLWGQKGAYPERYPKITDVHTMILQRPNILYVAHFHGRDDTLADDLVRLMEFSGPYLSAVQLNMTWPDTHLLWEFKKKFPFLSLIIPINRKAIIRNSLSSTLKKAESYKEVADAFLFDLSEGRGIPLSVEGTREFLQTFSVLKEKEGIRLAIAGGLCAASLKEKEVGQLIRDFPDVSIDAESGLRVGVGGLDRELVKRYLNRGIKLMSHQAAV